MEGLSLIFKFIGGFGLFIYGMHIMGEGLQKAAGNKMKQLLGFLTNNRYLGVAVGALVTAVVQSSSATTVMIVGFVNAGLVNLTQAVGVIMGANIGTTVTAWIVSLGEWVKFFKPSYIAPLVIGIGVIMMLFSKNKKRQHIGEVITGFGILFIGLEFMGDSIKPYEEHPAFVEIFATLGRNPILGVLAGAVVTALIQSSSASVAILQTLAAATLVPWNAAIYILLGQNIGTCVTALLSSIGTNKTAKRAAYIHLMFNALGTVIVGIGVMIFFSINTTIGNTGINKIGIGIFHTIFNVSATILLFPFAKHLVYLSGKIVRGEDKEDKSEKSIALRHLDERILETPSFAVENAIKEVVHMGRLAIDNSKLAAEALIEKDKDKYLQAMKNEKDINILEKMITEYLVKISHTPISESQNQIINNLFHSVNDIERVGDHAENIADLAEYYIEHDLSMSEVAIEELNNMISITLETIEAAVDAREKDSIDLVRKVIQNEEYIDALEEELREKHIRRLSQNVCDSTTGVVFLDTISNLERISDHALNIAYFVKDELL